MLLEDLQRLMRTRRMITQSGMYRLRVTNVHTHTDAEGNVRHIVNFNAMTPAHVSGWTSTNPDTGEVTTVPPMSELRDSGTPEAFQEIANRNISSGQRDGRDFVPTRGQIVDVVLETQTTSNNVTGLFISSISPLPLTEATVFDAASLFGEAPVEDKKETPAKTAEQLKEELAKAE